MGGVMTMHLPETGFGTPGTQGFSRFTVRIQGSEDVYPDWNTPELVRTQQFAGGSSYMTQASGFGPSTLTLAIEFGTRADYVRLNRLRLTESTLRLIAGYTSHDGTIRHINGHDYEDYPNTLLLAVSQPQNRIGGAVECMATFQRAWDPRLQEVPQ